MKLTKSEILATIGIVVGTTASVGSLGVTMASADSTLASTQTSSSITRSVVHQDQLQAMASALNMTTAQVQTHLKAHDLKQVVAAAGLSSDSYHQKVQAQLQSQLQAQGYSQTQIDNVVQHYHQHSSRSSKQ